MEHEALPRLAVDGLDLLLIVGRAERGGDERLRLAAREQAGSMGAGEDADFDRDRADLVEPAPVEPSAALEDLVAQHFLLQVLENRLRVGLSFGVPFRQAGDESVHDPVDGRVVLELVLDPHRVGERPEDLVLDFLDEVLRDFLLQRGHPFSLSGLRHQRVDAGHDVLDRRMRAFERLDHLRFRHFLRARLDHDDAVPAAGDDEIERAALALVERGVDHELAVRESDAHAGERPRLRNARQRQRRRRAGDRQHVGVVVRVGRDDERDDLRFVAPAVGEQRPDRAIDQAAREHFLFGRLAFALEEPAGDPPRGVGILLVVARQRQEVDPFARIRVRAGAHQNHGVAHAHDDGAVRLLGEASGLDGDRASADGDVACIHVPVFLSVSCASFN